MGSRKMIEKSNKRKKCSLSEDDVSALLDRYNARTVLALLQEVAQVPDVKIDWNELVKKTKTGIKNAREYQMLWRHLAYRHGLVDRLDDGALPLDDDSDLECELEATPAVSSEASAEAAAYVKVLIASGMQSESCLSNGTAVEAPLTINIPTGQTCRNPSESSCQNISMQGTNITIPIFVQIQPPPNVTTAEGLDTNGTSYQNLPPRRKRKPWSEAEDLELIAAVQKCGEGNWANILKGDFKGERTASQLSQRWAIIRKRQGPLVGNSSQLSEAQLAARRAVSLALDMPRVDNLKVVSSITSVSNAAANINHAKPAAAANINNAKPASAAAANINNGKPAAAAAAANINNGKPAAANINHAKPAAAAANINHAKPAAAAANINHAKPAAAQQDLPMAAAQKQGMAGPPKPRVPSKPTTPTPDSMVKAAAVAAGARIATPSDAATLLKAAQSKNAVRITPGGGGPLVKPSGTNTLPSNVHFIRTGLLSHSKTMPNPTWTGKPASPSVGHQRNTLSSSTVSSGPKASSTGVPNGTTPKTVKDSITTSGPKVANGTKPTPAAEHDSKTAEIPTEKPNQCNAVSEDKKEDAAKENGQEDHQGTTSRAEEKDTQPVVVNKSHIGETQTRDRNTSSTVDSDEAT